eukprot:scaffold4598_cov100-Isochrysis_galbana.AAC.2
MTGQPPAGEPPPLYKPELLEPKKKLTLLQHCYKEPWIPFGARHTERCQRLHLLPCCGPPGSDPCHPTPLLCRVHYHCGSSVQWAGGLHPGRLQAHAADDAHARDCAGRDRHVDGCGGRVRGQPKGFEGAAAADGAAAYLGEMSWRNARQNGPIRNSHRGWPISYVAPGQRTLSE